MQRDAGRAEVLDAQAGGEYVLADLVHDEDFPCRELCGCRRCVECEERLESGPLLVAQGRSGGGRHGWEGGAVKGGLCSWQLARASVEHTERERDATVFAFSRSRLCLFRSLSLSLSRYMSIVYDRPTD